jgi:glycogen operon protein
MLIADELERTQDLDLKSGARVLEEGTDFALFSEHATRVELCIFDEKGECETDRFSLHQHDDHIWRGFFPKVGIGLKYGYRVHGPYEPSQGHWFNPAKLLVDPFARELFGNVVNDSALFTYQPEGDAPFASGLNRTDSAACVPKSVVTGENETTTAFEQPQTPLCDTIIYELHVAGYSRQCERVPEGIQGTFEGLTSEPLLRHMQELGITAVEIMPIAPFNDEPHLWPHGLSNYWGYNSYNFFAPDPRFGNPRQFRAMVKRFHDAGIEVLLDVVYNHTGEGDALGPTLSLRGIDNASYYRHMPDDPGTYVNDTGCGNTLDLEHPYVREMVLSSLRYWAGEMGVDGFRFDLAPILGRSMTGFSSKAPFFRAIQDDPLLSRLKLIAEPWDIGPGGYQLGEFPIGWSEWNDKYRDTVRAFWRGDDSVMGELAGRMSGSREIFSRKHRSPQAGVNFIAAHDGFTLHDLVSYDEKHNEANGEDNRDGHSHNISWNNGVEGETDDPSINLLRNRQKRNMLATLFLSQGIPMLQAGDELGRSQRGNNNSYCQDNEINWINWQTADYDLYKFVAKLIELRRTFPQLRLHGFLTGETGLKGCNKDVTWLSPQGIPMQNSDWELPYARCFGFHLAGIDSDDSGTGLPMLVLLNAYHEDIKFKLPSASYGRNWHCLLNTNGVPDKGRRLISGSSLSLSGYGFMVLAGQPADIEAPDGDDLYSLSDLCHVAGIEESYTDLSGQTHTLSDEDKCRLVEVLHGDASTPEKIDRQVRKHIKQKWQTLIPSVIVLRQGDGGDWQPQIKIRVAEKDMWQEISWSIRLENGQMMTGVCSTERFRLIKSLRVEKQPIHELAFDLPPRLPAGYHHLELELGEQTAAANLIIAPAHCYCPPWMENKEHLWGIAHQLYSLGNHQYAGGRKDQGIGNFSDLDDLAYAAGKSGADILGVSPLHALFAMMPERASPYSPSSRLVLNPIYLDVAGMDGFDECPDLALIFEKNGFSRSVDKLVDYERVTRNKAQACNRLYSHFLAHGAIHRKREFASYCFDQGQKLFSFASFCSLSEHFDGRPLDEWPSAYQDPTSSEVRTFAKQNEDRIYFHYWLQWQAERQLQRVDDTCSEQGMKVGLYGDLAVGVAADGAECWANPSNYLQGISFGAPPDAFNAEGQNWCMPPFDPTALRKTAYQPFIDMLRENMRFCGALRMDHVMWLQRMFVIPHDKTASHGAYIRYPFDDLLGILALESTRAKCVIVGEDLGTVPLGFRERMEYENILSYRLMRFEKEHDGSFKAPCNYPYLGLATPSSHDLPTMRGFFAGDDLKLMQKLGFIKDEDEMHTALRDRKHETENLVKVLKEQGFLTYEHFDKLSDERMLDELVAAVSLYLARTSAALTMLNLEDLTGSVEQVNVPGTVREVPNWRHRLSFDPTRLLVDEKLRRLFQLIGVERRGEHHPH